jgi:C-terminal processing protease CtpA/Prc
MKIRNLILIFILILIAFITFMCTHTTIGDDTAEDATWSRKITSDFVEFTHPIPNGMITNKEMKEAMIQAKIKNLEETNDIFWGDLPGKEDELKLVFTQIENFISNNFSGFRGLSIDWDDYTEESYEKLEYVDNYGDFADIMTKMGYILQEGHTQIVPSRMLGFKKTKNFMLDKAPVVVTVPFSRIGACYTVTEDDKLVVSKLFGNYQSPYKLKKGDEIVGFNGVPWQEWIDYLLESEVPVYSSPGANQETIRYNLLKSGMANVNLFEKINILRHNTGEVETMDIVYIKPSDNLAYCTDLTQAEGLSDWRNNIFTHGKLKDTNIGYMYLRECPAGFEEYYDLNLWNPYNTSFADEFETAVLSYMDTDGLIIDLRTNDGGRPEPMYRGLSLLIDSEDDVIPFGAYRRDTSDPNRKALEEVKEYPWFPLKADEDNLHYDKPIIVLTGPDCISACDMLIALMSRYEEFTIIGKQPNGSATQVAGEISWNIGQSYSSDFIATYLTNMTFFFPDEPDNYLMRRTDFLDEEVWFTKDDLANGVDTVREYAIRLIKEQNGE